MSLFQALLYGIIQGLTEFLPISSTAHIRILPALFGWPDPGAAFTAVIQFGTLVAVLIYFAQDILRIIRAVVDGILQKNLLGSQDAKMGWMIAAGTVPVVVFGVLFKKSIETTLRSLYVISASMIALAVLLLAAELLTLWRTKRGITQKDLGQLSWREAVGVGFWQAVALIPGSSRSGVTITGGLFFGLTRETAARFSFLLSLPSVFAAGVYELIKERHGLLSSAAGIESIILATIVSGVVGYASIAFLLGYLKRHTTYIFIIYRFIVGLGLLWLLSSGMLQPV
ncbi:MAG TPA: undecaprenyl-diphosphatase UppP [Bacteroidota bacterium]|nr:undecaprenyl-diphosphatase UppP [Bacteroidota bacterium]